MIRQELNPVTCKLDTTVEKWRYAWLIRPCITRETRASSLVVDSGPCYHPLHYLKKGEEGRKRRKFYIYPDVTHTHTPGRAGKTLKGKRKKKADTRRADGQKRAQGGEGNKRTSGTNLHGETDLTKTAHTPKPHDTLRRGTRGKLGTKWGTSWWQTRKPKQLIKNRTQFLTTWRSCVIPLPGPWSSLPQLAKTAFKFQRIRCTICLTSPDNHQKKKTTPESRVPAWYMWHEVMQRDCKSCCEIRGFWMFGAASLNRNAFRRDQWDSWTSGTS